MSTTSPSSGTPAAPQVAGSDHLSPVTGAGVPLDTVGAGGAGGAGGQAFCVTATEPSSDVSLGERHPASSGKSTCPSLSLSVPSEQAPGVTICRFVLALRVGVFAMTVPLSAPTGTCHRRENVPFREAA